MDISEDRKSGRARGKVLRSSSNKQQPHEGGRKEQQQQLDCVCVKHDGIEWDNQKEGQAIYMERWPGPRSKSIIDRASAGSLNLKRFIADVLVGVDVRYLRIPTSFLRR